MNRNPTYILSLIFFAFVVFLGMTNPPSIANAVPVGTPTPRVSPSPIPVEECITADYYAALYYVYSFDATQHVPDDFTILMAATDQALAVPFCVPDLLASNIRVFVVHKYVYEFDVIMGLKGEKLANLKGMVTILGTGGAEYVGMWYQVCDFVPKYCTPEGVPVPPDKLPR